MLYRCRGRAERDLERPAASLGQSPPGVPARVLRNDDIREADAQGTGT